MPAARKRPGGRVAAEAPGRPVTELSLADELTEQDDPSVLRARASLLAGELLIAQREIARLQEEVTRQTARTAVLQDRDDVWQTRAERLELGIVRAQEETQDVRRDARAVTRDRDALRGELGERTAEVAGLREDATELRDEIERLEHRTAQQSVACAQLQDEAQGLRAEIEALTARQAAVSEELEETQLRLAQRARQLRGIVDSRSYRAIQLSWRARRRLRHPLGSRAAPKQLTAGDQDAAAVLPVDQ